MTEKQQKRFRAIAQYLMEAYPKVPTLDELLVEINRSGQVVPSKNVLANTVKSLCRRGLLTKLPRTQRSLEVTEKGKTVYALFNE